MVRLLGLEQMQYLYNLMVEHMVHGADCRGLSRMLYRALMTNKRWIIIQDDIGTKI